MSRLIIWQWSGVDSYPGAELRADACGYLVGGPLICYFEMGQDRQLIRWKILHEKGQGYVQ
jgi:hypothetical protein